MSQLPLQGVRVLECASVIAGPCCSYMLTLRGAETLKIERPGGTGYDAQQRRALREDGVW